MSPSFSPHGDGQTDCFRDGSLESSDFSSAKPSKGQEGLFLPHTKFSSAKVLVLSAWLRPPCSSVMKDAPPPPESSASGPCPQASLSLRLTGSCQARLLYEGGLLVKGDQCPTLFVDQWAELSSPRAPVMLSSMQKE